LLSTPLLDGIGKENGENMKTLNTVKSTFIALALLSVPNMFAANRGSLHVSSPEEVAGQPLAAGDYIVRWEDSGPNAELRIMQGKRVVATAVANVMPLKNVSVSDSVVLQNYGERRSLSLIFFSGKTVALEIREPSTGTNVSSNR
jgi:hypothetical protein